MNNPVSNNDYWEKMIAVPSPAYRELFDAEARILKEKITSDATVLDIGCGNGRNIQNILEKTARIVGIDNDEVAVIHARKILSSHPSVQIMHADAESLPFEDASFDVVSCLMILPNLDTKKEKAFAEMHRVLKDDGCLLLSSFSETALSERMKVYTSSHIPIQKIVGGTVYFDPSVGAHVSEQFSMDQLAEIARMAGFKITEVHTINTLGYVLCLKKIH